MGANYLYYHSIFLHMPIIVSLYGFTPSIQCIFACLFILFPSTHPCNVSCFQPHPMCCFFDVVHPNLLSNSSFTQHSIFSNLPQHQSCQHQHLLCLFHLLLKLLTRLLILHIQCLQSSFLLRFSSVHTRQ